MRQKRTPIDPADGLIVDEVGPWAIDKHERLKRYIDASRGARAKFIPPKGSGGASYIELFSGPGRSLIKDKGRIIDGSPLVAYRAAVASGARFSEIHVGDTDRQKLDTVVARLKGHGVTPVSHQGPASSVVDEVILAFS